MVTSSKQSIDAAHESEALAQAMGAATFIMNDDLAAAEAGLKDGKSSFHKVRGHFGGCGCPAHEPTPEMGSIG